MRTRAALVLAFALAAPLPARAEPAPAGTPVDVSAVRDKLVLLTDGKSHYVALVPLSWDENSFLYGDGKKFYAVPMHGGGGGEERWSTNFVDPRIKAISDAQVAFADDKYSVQCGDHKTEMKIVKKDDAKKILAAATFERSPRKWRAHALARDNQGKYYFVDRGRWPESEKNFRLFVGPKGNLKQLKMTNVVSDSEGEIFATRTGSLRLILNKNESAWVAKGKPLKLLLVPLEDNAAMIYNDLGVYTGERLGTPCDDL